MSPKSIRVLVVEDDENDYFRVSRLLRNSAACEYQLSWAKGYQEGLSAFDEEDFDVAIFDYQLGSETGLQLLQAVKLYKCDLPVILLTGHDNPEIDFLASRAGAADFLCKEGLTRVHLERSIRYSLRHAETLIARVAAENERNHQARLLDDVIKKMPVVLGQLDAQGRVVDVRGEGLARHGFAPEALLGRTFAELFPSSREMIDRALCGSEVDFTLHGPPGKEQWHVDFYAAAYKGSGATFFGRDVSERRWLERRLLSATDNEQQRIGADLHDGLGQKLTGLACLATALREQLHKTAPDQVERAGLIARLANEAIAETRALARGLCPVEIEHMGLVSALIELAGQTEMIHRIVCTLEAPDEPPSCDHLTAIHLYRICQEAINNAIRHGGASEIRVRLIARGRTHRLEIGDDGCGFDVERQGQLRNNGLRLMEYRAAIIGGTFTIDSERGGGTRIVCDFETPEPNGQSPSGSAVDSGVRCEESMSAP